MFKSTKTYGHECGLSAVFRQWRAKSHCRLLHGYALAFKLTFSCDMLDANGWVMDFGALKPIKDRLINTFDHSVMVAYDDPSFLQIMELEALGVARVVSVSRTGCEAFAKMVYDETADWLKTYQDGRVTLVSVECAEHGANSAIYEGEE
jgi:6-pyruvoyltetrahydropterin/6-carboxytetrahydropterin synthase